MTPPEVALRLALRRNDAGLRFRRQHGAGDYILDFYCAPARRVIEVDGGVHERGDQLAHDARRDAWLVSPGLLVVRYSARDVLGNIEGVYLQIMAIACDRRDRIASGRLPPPPSPAAPPPAGGGG